MRRLIYLSLFFSGLLHAETIAQLPVPDTSGCRAHNTLSAVIRGTIYTQINPDSIPAEPVLLFASCEKTMLIYGADEILSPVIESGLLNSTLLLQENFYTTDFFCLCDEYGRRLYFDQAMTNPIHDTSICILLYAYEMNAENPHQRVYTIFNNYCGNDGFKAYFFVLQNNGKTNDETTFFEGAYIHCLKYWYTSI